MLFLHGGFWRAEYNRAHVATLAAALANAGYTVCTPEFRRTGQPGGGWPGTFDDVAAAVDALPGLAARAMDALPGLAAAAPKPGRLTSGRLLLAGHSAGGHLALWAAGRHRLPAGSAWHTPFRRDLGVVALAPVSDLVACHAAWLDDGAADDLIGGPPERYPGRYSQADPAQLAPLGVPVRIVHGIRDDRVPVAMSRAYVARATAAGDEVTLDELPNCGHFELIDPLSGAWPTVVAAFRALAPVAAP